MPTNTDPQLPIERVAVITGAGGGLASVVARKLAAAGARLALIGGHQDRVDAFASGLGLPADQWLGLAADLRDAAATERAMTAAVQRFGHVDILVHLVGGYTGGTPVTEVARADVEGMLDQHLWTTFNAVRAFVPHATTTGWGRIVAVSTPVASEQPPKMAPYAIGKAALEALMGTLARESAGSGITVNMVRVRKIDEAREKHAAEPPKGAATWSTPEEIAAAILYLCSDEAGAVNGARIPLYGGA